MSAYLVARGHQHVDAALTCSRITCFHSSRHWARSRARNAGQRENVKKLRRSLLYFRGPVAAWTRLALESAAGGSVTRPERKLLTLARGVSVAHRSRGTWTQRQAHASHPGPVVPGRGARAHICPVLDPRLRAVGCQNLKHALDRSRPRSRARQKFRPQNALEIVCARGGGAVARTAPGRSDGARWRAPMKLLYALLWPAGRRATVRFGQVMLAVRNV